MSTEEVVSTAKRSLDSPDAPNVEDRKEEEVKKPRLEEDSNEAHPAIATFRYFLSAADAKTHGDAILNLISTEIGKQCATRIYQHAIRISDLVAECNKQVDAAFNEGTGRGQLPSSSSDEGGESDDESYDPIKEKKEREEEEKKLQLAEDGNEESGQEEEEDEEEEEEEDDEESDDDDSYDDDEDEEALIIRRAEANAILYCAVSEIVFSFSFTDRTKRSDFIKSLQHDGANLLRRPRLNDPLPQLIAAASADSQKEKGIKKCWIVPALASSKVIPEIQNARRGLLRYRDSVMLIEISTK